MSLSKRDRAEDLQSAGKLTVEGLSGILEITESLHAKISPFGISRGEGTPQTTGLTRFIYRTIGFFIGLSGRSLEFALNRFKHKLGKAEASPQKEALIAALNGVLGRTLHDKQSSLAIPMAFRAPGKHLAKEEVRKAGSPSFQLMIHGLCMSDYSWESLEGNRAADLALSQKREPIYLHYNSGLHISQNGSQFDQLMEDYFGDYADARITLLTHSMGGLVARSALYFAQQNKHRWPERIKKLIFLGTPHHGAVLEKAGNWIDTILGSNAFSEPLAKLGKIRSHGITDLRYGYLTHQDWEGRDPFAKPQPKPHHVPLPESIPCYAIAASTKGIEKKIHDKVIGDGLVTIQSALGKHKDPQRCLNFPDSHTQILRGLNHMELLHDKKVFETVQQWT